MSLSILLPTYNRSGYLIKNLNQLSNHIRKSQLQNEVDIIISNNQSPDNTDALVRSFIEENPDIQVKYFIQESNIGLEKNALFVLKQAVNGYVLFLGDDDFLEFDYFSKAIKHIKEHKSTVCVLPSFQSVDINGEIIIKSRGRDLGIKSSLTKKGFKNCLKNSWRGHQLSGLVLKNDNLYTQYKKNNVSNIYLFIFFISYLCLNGDTYHLTEHPVKITQPGQSNKDWGYGKDGLLNEVFDNYKKLPVNYFQKSYLQLYFFKKQSFRLWMYRQHGKKAFIKAFLAIWSTKNSTFGFKLIFPFLVLSLKLKKMMNK